MKNKKDSKTKQLKWLPTNALYGWCVIYSSVTYQKGLLTSKEHIWTVLWMCTCDSVKHYTIPLTRLRRALCERKGQRTIRGNDGKKC